MKFISRFVLERGIGVDEWKLAEPLVCTDGKHTLEIPAGFKTDFASIPRFFHRLLPKNGTYDAAAVLHDFLYAQNGAVTFAASAGQTATRYQYDREQCDVIFRDAMQSLGVSAWKRAAMFRAVRMCGGGAWNGHAKKLLAKGKSVAIKFASLAFFCSFFFTGCMSARLADALKDSSSTFAADIRTVWGTARIQRANPQPGQTAIIHPDGRLEVTTCPE